MHTLGTVRGHPSCEQVHVSCQSEMVGLEERCLINKLSKEEKEVKLRKIMVACTLLLPLERCQVLVERVVTLPHLLKCRAFMNIDDYCHCHLPIFVSERNGWGVLKKQRSWCQYQKNHDDCSIYSVCQLLFKTDQTCLVSPSALMRLLTKCST